MQDVLNMVRQVTFFLLIATLLVNLLSGSEYKKYIQYAVGLIVMVMVVTPVLKIVHRGFEVSFYDETSEIQEEIKEQEKKMRELENEYEEEMMRKGELPDGE